MQPTVTDPLCKPHNSVAAKGVSVCVYLALLRYLDPVDHKRNLIFKEGFEVSRVRCIFYCKSHIFKIGEVSKFVT